MRRALCCLLFACAAASPACVHKHRGGSAGPPRSYHMGFSWLPPTPNLNSALQTVDAFAPHADSALILVSPPWQALLNGGDPTALVTANELGLAQLYRGRGLDVVVSIDPTDGTDRSRNAPELVTAGRSLAEPAVQALFRDYAVAMAVLLQPRYLSLASETNLVRQATLTVDPTIYDGVRQAAIDAAAAIRLVDAEVQLFATIQVEVAWGLPGGSYQGIATDLADFPFVQAIGLSSYPFLGGITNPDALADDYYGRIAGDAALPVLMIEGGWPSVPYGALLSDEATQVHYVRRNAELLDLAGAVAWFQISFTDLVVAAWSPEVEPFANLGLVSTAFTAKPALAAWDDERRRPLQ
ncbi:MAG: hypothetical protein U1E73_10300 [Planctomycetota bacterium]